MSDTNRAMTVSHSHVGGRLLNVVPMLLLFSLGFVLGMTYSSKFPSFYLPFVAPLPSPTPPPPPFLPPPPPPPTNPQAGAGPIIRSLAPSTVTHNMTDEELLWWASMTPKAQSSPYHRVPKVAFLFLARGDLPLRPLWEKFFAGHAGFYSIYVHTDPSYTRTLTFADWNRWRRTGPYPHTHRAEEVAAGLIGEIRSGERSGANCSAYRDAARGVCFVFARKFTPDTLEPLLRLAPKVLGFG